MLNATTALLLLSVGANENSSRNSTLPYPKWVNESFVIEIVHELHDVYKFKNFVFYITEKLSLHSYVFLKFFNNFWKAFPTAPNIIIRSSKFAYLMDGFLSTPSLCLVLTTGPDDPIMELASESLKGVHMLKTIFVLFPILDSDDVFSSSERFKNFSNSIHLTYEWIWKHQFTNTILLTKNNNVFIHEPYPVPTIVNKTENWTAEDFFINYMSDFKGYVVDTPIRFDVPRVFYGFNRQQNGTENTIISGTSLELFVSFVESINATLNDSTFNSSQLVTANFDLLIAYIADELIEIGIHSFTDMYNMDIGRSYPIGINDWCIMVPYKNRSPDNLYLMRTFQPLIWYLIFFSLVYISIILWMCITDGPKEFSISMLQALCSLLCIVPTKILLIPTARMRFLYVMLFLFGFMLSNMYISKMASFLTTSPQAQQILDVEDIISEDLHVMVVEFEYNMLAASPNSFNKRFLKQLQIVDKAVLDLHRDNMNTSFGYSVQTDRWKFLNKQQKYLKKPLFRLSEICVGPFYHVFPMQFDSHLSTPLKDFIMYASQCGLYKHWEESAFADALRLNGVYGTAASTHLLCTVKNLKHQL
ncbi:uncharacterized protein LOC119674280 [Teleopsis dalmanni]|uniref:uncharacterized protein LOC119674280 n=1 Tax=Teleopsis dalmanni TaxID=139649 RepID=UPI0018CF11FC|nr:uncharacterized protein LOC119674280 [Teleopsis dalmanni]